MIDAESTDEGASNPSWKEVEKDCQRETAAELSLKWAQYGKRWQEGGGGEIRWEKKWGDENDVFEAIIAAETEVEMNKWKYTQDIFRTWNQWGSEWLNKDGKAWRRILDDFQPTDWNGRWSVVPFTNIGDVFGGDKSKSWVWVY